MQVNSASQTNLFGGLQLNSLGQLNLSYCPFGVQINSAHQLNAGGLVQVNSAGQTNVN